MNINAIVIPLIRKELCELKTWLRHCPASGEKEKTLYLSIDTCWSDRDKSALKDSFSRSSLFRENWKLEFVECRMKESESFYEKEPSKPIDLAVYPYGLKSGPNLQFFRTLGVLKPYREKIGAVLLMESDAFPVVYGWLSCLVTALSAAPANLLLAGPRYAGGSYLNEQIKEHFNGNSVYCIGSPDFYEFLDCWETLLLKSLHIASYMAYDVVVLWYANFRQFNAGVERLTCEKTNNAEKWYRSRTMDLSDVLINFGGSMENHHEYQLDIPSFNRLFPKALIVHGKCFITQIHTLRAARVNPTRRHRANLASDFILQRKYEQSLIIGLEDFKLIRLMTQQVNRLSKQQQSLIQREWSKD
jgi:hypothetical protein